MWIVRVIKVTIIVTICKFLVLKSASCHVVRRPRIFMIDDKKREENTWGFWGFFNISWYEKSQSVVPPRQKVVPNGRTVLWVMVCFINWTIKREYIAQPLCLESSARLPYTFLTEYQILQIFCLVRSFFFILKLGFRVIFNEFNHSYQCIPYTPFNKDIYQRYTNPPENYNLLPLEQPTKLTRSNE